jgi:amino acid adenylation domain-containing protein
MFEAQCDRIPWAVAVSSAEESLTFTQLERRANSLARRLQRLGVSVDTPVGVCAERSLDMVVGVLAVLKAGGACVPLDPAQSRKRLASLIEDIRPLVVLVQKEFVERLPAAGTLLTLEDLPEENRERPYSWASLSSLAYVICTTGPSEIAKWVMIPHAAIASYVLWMMKRFPLRGEDAILQTTPFTLVSSIWELFLPLLAGARLVMARPSEHQNVSYLTSTVATEKVTVLQLTSTLLEPFLEDDGVAACGSLRWLFCGDRVLSGALVGRALTRLSAEVCNLRGVAECAISAWLYRRGNERAVVTAGLPLDNIRPHVLDMRLEPLCSGAPGELCVGGARLARGYWGRPDLTAERFVPDAWSSVPGERLYRTGSQARCRENGEIEDLGN